MQTRVSQLLPSTAHSPACKPQLTLGHSLAPGAQSSLGRQHYQHHKGDHHHNEGDHHHKQVGHISMNNFHFLGIDHLLLISREHLIYQYSLLYQGEFYDSDETASLARSVCYRTRTL